METTLRHDNKQQEAQPRGQEDSRGGGDPSYGCRAWELREGRGSLLPAQGQVCHSTRKQYILTPTGFTNEDFFFLMFHITGHPELPGLPRVLSVAP